MTTSTSWTVADSIGPLSGFATEAEARAHYAETALDGDAELWVTTNKAAETELWEGPWGKRYEIDNCKCIETHDGGGPANGTDDGYASYYDVYGPNGDASF